MADERYRWLDKKAAERLLRGESVDPVDDRARGQAERLAEVLDSARPAPLPSDTDGLPGEEAALAAFRKAAAERGAGTWAAGEERPDLGAVRPTAPHRRVRLGRPLRWGLAASLAGIAVGGVAVAAGTGVLPTFGEDRDPLPASSISAEATPGPLESPAPTGGPDSRTPHPPGITAQSPSPSAGRTSGGPATGDPAKPGTESTPRTPDAGGELRKKTKAACKDFRAGRLDGDRRRWLKTAARGETLQRFCDGVLGDTEGSGDGKDGGGKDDGRGGKDDGDGGTGDGGAVPAVSWKPLLPQAPPEPQVPIDPRVPSVTPSPSTVPVF